MCRIQDSSVYVSSQTEKISLYHDENNRFHVEQNGNYHKVKNYLADPMLRNITKDRLKLLLKKGYISLHKVEGGEYSIKANVKGLGGFLLTGVIVHQTSRALGYIGVWTGATSMVVAGAITGGPAGASAAFLAATNMVGPGMAAVETASLTLGVAASWIPGLP